MNVGESSVADERCIEFVDLITAYLDGDLTDERRSYVDAHLVRCEGCRNVLAQWRTVIQLTGRLSAGEVEGIDPLTRDRLQSIFRVMRRR